MGKLFFKAFMAMHVFLYRLTNGKIGAHMNGLNVLLLNTKGSKSGKQRTTPLGYFRQDNDYIIVASNAGADRHPGWYYNLKKHPNTTIQINDQRLTAHAEIMTGEERALAWQNIITESPMYKEYADKTEREIPLFLLNTAA